MRKVNHSAWLMCAAGMLAMFCNMGLCSNILAVYLPFIEATGISGSQGSAIISVRCFSSFAAMFLVSRYYEKISLRNGLTLATGLGTMGYAVFAIGGPVAVYYIGAVILGIAYGFGTMIPVSVLITHWFRQGKGTALGICSMGTGIATIVFAPLITANTQAHGLRSTCLIMAGFMLLCTAVIWLLVRNKPEDVGQLPYGEIPANGNQEKAEAEKFEIPTPVWIGMMIMLFLVGGAGQTASSHVSIAVTTAGYTATQAGFATSVYGAALIVGKLLMGRVADRIGAKKSSILFMLVFLTGCLMPLLMNGTSTVISFLFALILGLGCPFFTVGVTLWASDLASEENYEKTLRWYQIMYSAGGIVCTAIPGRIADLTHEYKSSYLMLLIMTTVSMIQLIIYYRKRETLYH